MVIALQSQGSPEVQGAEGIHC